MELKHLQERLPVLPLSMVQPFHMILRSECTVSSAISCNTRNHEVWRSYPTIVYCSVFSAIFLLGSCIFTSPEMFDAKVTSLRRKNLLCKMQCPIDFFFVRVDAKRYAKCV